MIHKSHENIGRKHDEKSSRESEQQRTTNRDNTSGQVTRQKTKNARGVTTRRELNLKRKRFVLDILMNPEIPSLD